MHPVVTFLLGMLGALAPEIVRVYAIRHDPSKFRWSWFFLVVSLAFAALGGVLALVLPATTYWAAVYVGVSTPVLVSSMVKKGRESTRTRLKGPRTRPVQLSTFDSFVYGL
jgi:hypothetical protein